MKDDSYSDIRTQYQYSVIDKFYEKIQLNTPNFSESSIYDFLKSLSNDDLDSLRVYIENMDFDLYYDWNMGIKKDYDYLDKEYAYFRNIISTMQKERKRK